MHRSVNVVRTHRKSRFWLFAAALFALPVFAFASADAPLSDDLTNSSDQIISRYVAATQAHNPALENRPVELEIDASVPKLKKNGRLRALRVMTSVGKTTYRVLGFQGDNTVKSQVIARYLQAEQQAQGQENLAILPANYRFKYKGEKARPTGEDAYVFQVSPRKKKVGLFKGEVWLDARTYLPVYEKGRLVKNPSIFFKKVDFERDYAIRGGVSVPARMSSTINTRIIGKVELNVNYSSLNDAPADPAARTNPEAVAVPAVFNR